jgi:N,N'-diacetyllegionaminate synthase
MKILANINMTRQTQIIAECAQGYARSTLSESLELAKWLTRSAKSCGADAIKFQLIIADELACPDYKYYNLFKTLELGGNGWAEVKCLAKELEIELIFDIFGRESLSVAEQLNINTIKIHPTDFTNTELLGTVSSSTVVRHVIAGCGGATEEEICASLRVLSSNKKITLLLGFQGYPTPRADNSLNRLNNFARISESIGTPIQLGFADHADPTDYDATHLAIMALGHGATVIEKHLTLARCLKLEDHESALSPDEFERFVQIIRACDEAAGETMPTNNTGFDLPKSEQAYRTMVNRHVVACRDISVGERLADSDLCLKRSASIAPITTMQTAIGKVAIKPIPANSPVCAEALVP